MLSGISSVNPIPRNPSPLSAVSPALADVDIRAINYDTDTVSSKTGAISDSAVPADVGVPPEAGDDHPRVKEPISTHDSEDIVPTSPLPDSLLLRSTFTALEHSTSTLKRLSKTVLSCTNAYLSTLEQLEKAEDDVLAALGELGRWLEGGYGVHDSIIWEDDVGIRKAKRVARQTEREEIEIMVEQSVRAVRSELKRNGLAGGGAQTRFDHSAKHFYQQTSAYLAPQASSSGPSSQSLYPSQSSSSHDTSFKGSSTSTSAPGDRAQASRLAQFDLARYNHHSTLLYAVPPTSLSCLDLLVGLYTWVGGQLSGIPHTNNYDDLAPSGRSSRLSMASQIDSKQNGIPRTPTHRNVSDSSRLAPSTLADLRPSLSSSLSRLSVVRAELLKGWAARDEQTNELEDAAALRKLEKQGGGVGGSRLSVDMSATPVSSQGIEHQKPRKMHKLHRSVGGRLRDLISTSASRGNLNDMSSQSSSRHSFDGGIRSSDSPSNYVSRYHEVGLAESLSAPSRSRFQSASEDVARTSTDRPRFSTHHSDPSSNGNAAYGASTATDPNSLDLAVEATENDQREDVGRKKEGVLWGAATWEDLSKHPGKSKYEKLWVVLDHSRIYEYKDSSVGRPEAAHAVIDLKFASIRDGRSGDRRFAFEIVTPTQGKRMYQASSELDQQQWSTAICNAIESCINGTSSVRTFDTSKLRSPSGSLDDHALPSRQLFDGPASRLNARGLPLPTIPGSPGAKGSRRSMPPSTRSEPHSPTLSTHANGAIGRQRQTSFKKKMRQSAEIAGEKWSSYVSTPKESPRMDFSTPRGPGPDGRPPSRGDGTRLQVPHSASPTGSPRNGSNSSWNGDSEGSDIEKRVMEMAGLGIDMSPSASSSTGHGERGDADTWDLDRSGMTVATSESVADDLVPDMDMLRQVVNVPANTKCADCGKPTKRSRWATLCLRGVPMVMFLCIRCVGVHRGLGTHVSKPRSVDLDIWSPESILLAREWGNERGNLIWERQKPLNLSLNEDDMAAFIRAKYVDGQWLSDDDRTMFGLSTTQGVGTAL